MRFTRSIVQEPVVFNLLVSRFRKQLKEACKRCKSTLTKAKQIAKLLKSKSRALLKGMIASQDIIKVFNGLNNRHFELHGVDQVITMWVIFPILFPIRAYFSSLS